MPEVGQIYRNGGKLTEFRDDYIKIEGSQVDIDADGANGQHGKAPAYAPDGYGGPKPLDVLQDAGSPGDWYGIVTDSSGDPIVQRGSDPCPGAYVSATSLQLLKPDGSHYEATDPMAYVDAATVPFLVICPELRVAVKPIVFGCRAVLTNTENNVTIEAVVADGGNRNTMGEISYAAAQQLGNLGTPLSVNNEGHLLTIEIYPGTAAVVDGVTYPLQPS